MAQARESSLAGDGRTAVRESVSGFGATTFGRSRVGCHWTDRPLVPFRASRDMVGNKCATLAYRFLLAFRGVLRRLQFKLGIDLGAEQHDVKGNVEPEHQHDHRAERAVELVVIGEVRHVERETGRGQ